MTLRTKHSTPCVLVVFCIMLNITPLSAEDRNAPPLAVKQGIPAGFEELNAPHETAVDVYYGGLKIGSYRAVFTPKTILFAHPEEMVAKIPALKFEESQRVVTALTGELPTNADQICGHVQTDTCDKLTPEVAGLIFNEGKFQAEIFLNPGMLAIQDTHKEKILPPAPDVYSSVHALNGGITGGGGASQDYSFISNSTYAYGSGRINTIGIFTAEEKQINALTASLDRWGLDNRAGYFDSKSSQLLPQIPMLGASVGTSLNTNLALRDAAGSRLTVFLPQRSYVSIIHNGVIYTTDFYEAGNQVLNTDSLPEGTYEVTLRIRDTGGITTEEKRFFAKNFAIPPEDQPIYFGQLGTIRDTQTRRFTLSAGEGLVANVGTIQRVSEIAGGTANLQVVKDELFTEGGIFLLLPPNHQLRTSVLISSAKDLGFGASYLGYFCDKTVSVASDLRTLYSGKTTPDIIDESDPVRESSKQVSATAAYQVTPLTNIALQGTYTKTGAGEQKYAYGPALRYDFWQGQDSTLSFTTDSSKTELGTINSVYIRYSMRLGQWGYDAEGGARRGNSGITNGTTKTGNAHVTWNGDQTPGQLTVIGAGVQHDDESDDYSVDFDHRGRLGNVRMLGHRTNTTTDSNTFYSGNFGFSVVNADGGYSWGGNQQQSSGIVVKNTGNATDVPMMVLVNNAEQGTFTTGESTTLFVTPYQTYKISIKPLQSSAIDYDGSVKNVTLYPGNVLPMVWAINRINVVLGHVVLPDGTPLVNAKLEEARNISVTDDEGMFQGELLELSKITFKRHEEELQIPGSAAKAKDKDFDIFSIFPPVRKRQSAPSKMSPEEQSRVMADLFGEDAIPPAESVKPLETTTSTAETATQEVIIKPAIVDPTLPSRKVRPAIRCSVELPDIKEINGVYIYSQPLTCNPIPFEDNQKVDEKTGKPVEDKQAYWSPFINPMRVSKLVRPLLSTHAEFASAILNIQPKPEPETAMAAVPPSVPTADVVQLGAYKTESEALAAREVIVKNFAEIEENKPAIIKADLGSKGTFYRLRVGNFGSKMAARLFCNGLSARGQDCIVPVDDVTNARAPVVKVRAAPLPPAQFPLYKYKKSVPLTLPEPVYESISAPDQPAPESLPAESDAKLSVPPIIAHEDTNVMAPANSNATQVQLGAYRSEAVAQKEWNMIVSRFSEVNDKAPRIIKVDLGEKGIYYRLRVGSFTNNRDARRFCAMLSAQGQGCIVPIREDADKGRPEVKDNMAGPATEIKGMGGPFIEFIGP